MTDNMKFLLVVLFVPIVSIIICFPFDSIRKTYSEQINETETYSSKLGVDTTIYNNPLMGIRFNKFTNWDFFVFYGFEPYCWGIVTPCKVTLHPDYISSPKVAGFQIYAEKHCNCSSLVEETRKHYTVLQNYTSSFYFLNDSKSLIGGNIPAWEIEYKYADGYGLDILAIKNGTSYLINFYADQNSYFMALPEVREMISSIQFIPIRQISAEEIPPYVEGREDLPPKMPSFMPP